MDVSHKIRKTCTPVGPTLARGMWLRSRRPFKLVGEKTWVRVEIERGRPEALIPAYYGGVIARARTHSKNTILAADRRKYLEGQNIIFRTDSARSYKTRLSKVVCDNFVRCNKRVKVSGKWKGQMPNYVKVTTRTLPGGNKKVPCRVLFRCAQPAHL
ncbi:unnamed protein product [Symbiodinium natans]|uniref:Uncharacterized protein n=1 Tax=Symbiodinium natans TaxID=878477 RepID=A0A812HX07_9DINO|nr:unnamed protein product [Symbiodinium natans]